ncbi:MAG: hypothetical protein DYG92_01205 [Leptolyngbya sp. PLA1]|nr:hypothetical protein [Leptolyngbya sp. PLA1]
MTRADEGVTDGAWRREVEALLGALPGLLARLDALSRHQRELIESDDAEALSALVEDRARVLGALTSCLEGLERRRAEWSRAGQDHQRVQAAIDGMAAVANEVAARDRIDSARMRDLRDDMARRLVGLGAARQAAGAYAAAVPGGPRFQDREG